MALTKITSRILDSSGVTILGTIATGVWQGTPIADDHIASATTWNTASTDRLKWDGGATGLTASTGRTSLGLGTVATTAASDYATAAQGTKADTAHGWGDHGSGGYITGITFANVSSKPTTLSGYGITDAAPIASPIFTGTVGIGASASYPLHVSGNVIAVEDATATVRLIGTAGSGKTFDLKSDGGIFKIRDVNSGRELYHLKAGSSGYHDWYIDDSFKMRLNSSGNLGIGTTSPLGKLSIGSGSFADTNVVAQISTGGGGTGAYFGYNKNGSYGLLVGMSNGLDGWTAGVIRQITTDPLYFIVNNNTIALSIASTGAVQATRARSNTVGDVALSINPSDSTMNYGFRVDSTTNNLNLDNVDNSTNLLAITSGGNVGIGTSSPFGVTSNRIALSVNGTTSSVVNIGTGGAQRGYFYAESNQVLLNTTGALPLHLGTNGSNYLTIASGGATTLFTNIGSGLDNAQLTIKSDGSAVTTGLVFVNAANTSSFNDLAGIASYIESGNAKGNLKFWTRNSDGNNNDRTTRLTISSTGAATLTPSQNGDSLTINNTGTYAGTIAFNQNGTNAGYVGSIRAFEGSGTADNGVGLFSRTRMSFYINSATPSLTISSGGAVTKPNQPAFKAGRNGSISLAAGATIVFNEHTSSNHFNQGGHYNNTNGRFTAPVSGTYIFSTVVIFEGLSTNQDMTDSFNIYKNTTNVSYSFRRANYVVSTTGTGGYYVDHANIMLQLAANDYVYIRNARALAIHGNTNYCYFYGYLLG
jgi:hypothetical protein